MAKVLFGPIVSEARNKQGSVVFSRGPYGAYTRAWVDPDQTETAARKTCKDRMAAASYAWNNSLSASQRLAWEAYATALAYTDVFANLAAHPGRTVFIQQFLYLDNLGLATLTTPPNSTDRRSLTTASLSFSFPTNTLSLNLTWPPGQPQPPVIVYATPPLNPATNFPGHRFRQIATLSSAVGYPYNLWTAYNAVHGLPLPGKKIFTHARPVHPTTGLAGGKLMAHSTDPGVVDGCRIYHSANQTVPNNTNTVLTYDSEHYDNGGLHNPAANPTRITFQKPGIYLATAAVRWEQNATGRRILFLRLNGSDFFGLSSIPAVSGDYTYEITAFTRDFDAGDYIESLVHQDSGGDLTVDTVANMSPEFTVQWLGA